MGVKSNMKKRNLKQEIIKKNVSLRNFTTFKIGGRAKYFLLAKNEEELIKGIDFAKKKKLPFFILGGGSNLLISDKGYNGLVIKIVNSKYKILGNKIHTEAGVPLSLIVNNAIKQGLTGLEWAVGIPGTIGGAIRGNAGVSEASIADIVKKVIVLEKEKINKYKNKDCKWGYRESIFKKKKNLIILFIEIQLKKGNKKKIQEKIKKYLNYRKANQPLNFFSAGSIFKNKRLKIKDKKLLKEFPELKEFNKKGIIPSGYLVEKLGLKGEKIGKVQISKKHANFIINKGGGRASDVLKLIKLIKDKVKKKFKIKLEEEIQFLGF